MINQPEQDIKDSEIKQAFELLERKRLKKLFNDIENNHINRVSTKITPIFTWVKYAVAASVFGLVITTGVLFLNNGKETELANIVKQENPQSNNELVLLNERNLKSNSKSIVVLTDNSFGFAQEKQKINITTYEIGHRIDTLITVSKSINDTLLKKKFNMQVDSLQGLINSYEFNNQEFKIYLRNSALLHFFKIENNYYMKLDKKYYYIKVGKFDKIIKIDKKEEIDKLKKIDYINDIE